MLAALSFVRGLISVCLVSNRVAIDENLRGCGQESGFQTSYCPNCIPEMGTISKSNEDGKMDKRHAFIRASRYRVLLCPKSLEAPGFMAQSHPTFFVPFKYYYIWSINPINLNPLF